MEIFPPIFSVNENINFLPKVSFVANKNKKSQNIQIYKVNE